VEDALKDMWRSVAVLAPKILVFILILVVGWIVAKLVAKAIDKVLERVGFDRAVERGGVRRALQNSRYDASTIVSKIVYYALLLFVLQLAFGVFGPNPVSSLLSGVIAFLPKLFVALIIVVVAAAVAAAVRDIVSNTLGGLSYGRMLANIASVFILGLGIIAALNQVGIALTVTLPVLIAILGTIGGILIVGVGGGLIKPMQQRWEDYLTRAEREGRNMREHVSRRSGDMSNQYQPAGAGQHAAGQVPTAGPYPPVQEAPATAQYPQQSYPQQSYPQQSYPQQSSPQQPYPQQSNPQGRPLT
jgi:Conserved TM helix